MDDIDLKDIAKLLGRKGGNSTSKKYGKEHYIRLAENMNKKIKERKLAKLASELKK